MAPSWSAEGIPKVDAPTSRAMKRASMGMSIRSSMVWWAGWRCRSGSAVWVMRQVRRCAWKGGLSIGRDGLGDSSGGWLLASVVTIVIPCVDGGCWDPALAGGLVFGQDLGQEFATGG